MIFLAIFQIINRNTSPENNIEIDPASGEKIAFTGYAPYNGNGVLWIGFEELNTKGMTKSLTDDVKKIIQEYAKYDWKKELKRVSLYKNSYSFENPENDTNNYYKLKFALNINEKDVYMRITLRGYDNYEIKLYNDENYSSELKTLDYCSVLVCPPEVPEGSNVVNNNYDG